MASLIKNELYKAFRLKKLYLLILVTLIIEIAAALLGRFGGGFPELSGQQYTLLLFDNLPYLFVIFTAIFISDSWVDEHRSGALKLPMLRPVNRIAFLNAKVISLFVCAAVLMGATLMSACVAYTVTFGWGKNTGIGVVLLILISGVVTLFPVFGFGLLVLFIAILTDNMSITVSSAMGLLLVSQMLEVSEGIRDYSIIYLIRVFYKNLFVQFQWEKVIINIVVIAIYIIIFYLGSVLLFRKKDVLA